METFRDFYISCFSFFLLDRPFLIHNSLTLRLILKIKVNEFFGCFCSKPVTLSPCFVYKFCLSCVTGVSCCFPTHFQ